MLRVSNLILVLNKNIFVKFQIVESLVQIIYSILSDNLSSKGYAYMYDARNHHRTSH